MDISFFIVRCITNERNAFYWRVCYDRIHSIYPDAKIYVVDDKSRLQRYTMPSRYTTSLSLQPYSYYTKEQLLDYGKLYPDLQVYQNDIAKLYTHWQKYGKYENRKMPSKSSDNDNMEDPSRSIWEELPNLEYIKSDYNGRGEILGYYYYYLLHPTEKAIILHDSVFINEPIQYNKHNKCEFLWRFNPDVCVDNGQGKDRINSMDIINMIVYLGNSYKNGYKPLINFYKRKNWYGCFGIMSVVNWSLLETINVKYNFFETILLIVDNRYKRQCLERVFGFLMCYELQGVNVLYGNIRNYCKWGISFQLDMLNKDTVRQRLPITKVWSGR